MVPPSKPKISTSGCRVDLWAWGVFLILACNDTIQKSTLFFSKKNIFFVFVLLSALVERVSVSPMQDFHQLGPLGRVGLEVE